MSFCSLQSLLNTCSSPEALDSETGIRMLALYDNEEVGSVSAQGAASSMTENVMRKIVSTFSQVRSAQLHTFLVYDRAWTRLKLAFTTAI